MPEVKSKVGQLEIGGHKKGLNAPGCCTCWNSDDITECALSVSGSFNKILLLS